MPWLGRVCGGLRRAILADGTCLTPFAGKDTRKDRAALPESLIISSKPLDDWSEKAFFNFLHPASLIDQSGASSPVDSLASRLARLLTIPSKIFCHNLKAEGRFQPLAQLGCICRYSRFRELARLAGRRFDTRQVSRDGRRRSSVNWCV